ncbi:MAG: hypothetical protein AAGK04_12525, partial [Planctomycetota bacterium]
HGLSMVTLYQLRRYCAFALDLIRPLGSGLTPLSPAVAAWRTAIASEWNRVLDIASNRGDIDDDERWRVLASLGAAAEIARESMYHNGLGKPVQIERDLVLEFFERTRDVCDDAIRRAKRDDGLYESYNVLHWAGASATVERLQPMLEGQVAVLSSGTLAAHDAAELLDALFESDLYREDQRTFMLYPRVDLPGYMDRNIVPQDAIDSNELLSRALNAPETELIIRDAAGAARFHADLDSHRALGDRLDRLAGRGGWTELVASHQSAVHDAFERTFRHARFTGRSGRMHKYEGLGSVYWHMVSKLLLASQECFFEARDAGADQALLDRLREHYFAVRSGLGFHKTPAEVGAVPHEPYSHTPWNAGAQQPGMTGQVKEGVIARLGELGVRLRRGVIGFDPTLLDRDELLDAPGRLRLSGNTDRSIEVPSNAVALSICGTPIVLRMGDTDRVVVVAEDGAETAIEGRSLTREWSRAVFARGGRVDSIHVEIASDDQ